MRSSRGRPERLARVRRGGGSRELLRRTATLGGQARAQADDPGLRAAAGRFPQLVLGPDVRPANGAGPAILYGGADPANPDLCLMRLGSQPAKGWFGIWLTDWPGAEQARTVLGRLLRHRTGGVTAGRVLARRDAEPGGVHAA